MESARAKGASAGEAATVAATACPRCGEHLPPFPAVRAALFDGVALCRCRRCGIRSTHEAPARYVFSCERCGVPFLAEDLLPQAEHACPACRNGELPAELPGDAVVRATEREIEGALASRWRFVAGRAIGEYLDRVTRQIARRVDGAPEASRILVVEDEALRTLALPSGTLLVTTGVLRFLEDEAELAFVLGHELAHAASGDAAVRLVRMGFDALSRGSEAPAPDAWAAAALDLLALGYGRNRERDADARALEALLAQDYDPESAFRFLRRLDAAIEAGEPAVAEWAASHPPAAERQRRLERALWGHPAADGMRRVNREVYRRAAGPQALASGLHPVEPGKERGRFAAVTSLASGERPPIHWGWWIAAGALLGAAALAYLLS